MQVIKYKWENWEPFFITEDKEKLGLMNQDIAVRIGFKKCIGFFKDGKHFPCSERIAYGWLCSQCMLRDNFFLCMKCGGKECRNEKRRRECKKENYYIYLAAFDSLLKVGISQERRFLERLVEQGADFGAKIAFMKDGKEVRKIEQEIKDFLGIVDRVSGEQKYKALFCNPNIAVTNIFNALNQLKSNGFDLMKPEIYDLRTYYNLHNILFNPYRLEIRDNLYLVGKIVAAKGNIIILNKDKGFFSLNAHDMIGRDIESI